MPWWCELLQQLEYKEKKETSTTNGIRNETTEDSGNFSGSPGDESGRDNLLVQLRQIEKPAVMRRLAQGDGIRARSLDSGESGQGFLLPVQAFRESAVV